MADHDDAAASRYRGVEGARYHQLKHGVTPAAYEWVSRARAGKLAPFVRPHHDVVELGVGTGWNLAALRCERKVGIDLADSLRGELEARGIEFAATSAALAAESFDVAICHHMLEHVSDPAHALTELARLLRRGGRLLLFVPYERERRYRRYVAGDTDGHLHSWNAQSLGNLVSSVGLAVETAGLGPFGYDRFAASWASRAPVHEELGELTYRAALRIARTLRPVLEVRIVARKPG